jgi:hypothetical protein
MSKLATTETPRSSVQTWYATYGRPILRSADFRTGLIVFGVTTGLATTTGRIRAGGVTILLAEAAIAAAWLRWYWPQ